LSTTYHDSIATGAAANASTFNTPLGDLDGAIGAANDRIDNLILSDGASDAEVVDTRNGYTVLDQRIDDLVHVTKTLYVDASFHGKTAANRFLTISTAMSAASAGSIIYVAPGTYTEDVTFSQINIKLIGAGRPSWDGSALAGGTIIIGMIDCAAKRGAAVRDLGIDIRTTAQVDAIESGTTASTTNLGQSFHNIVAIGKGAAVSLDRGHGILNESGSGAMISHCKFYLWYHGIALRCSDATVSDCYFFSCLSDAVVIKSDTGSGNAWRNTITNCIIDGTTGFSAGGPMRVQSNNASFTTRYNTISNVVANNVSEASVIIQQVAGTCSNVLVSNVVSYNAGDVGTRADFDIDTATDILLTNCMSANRAAGFGFRSTGSRVRAINCSSDGTGAGRVSTTATGWDYLDLGSGLGIDINRVQNVLFDRLSDAFTLRDAANFVNVKTVPNGSAVDAITCLWIGNGNTTSLVIEIMVNYESGTIARLYHYHIVIVRPNSTTLVATSEALGTAPLNTTGTGNSMSLTVDVATANTAIVKFTGSGGSAAATYSARVLSLTTSSWYITP
jgi:hypothetical protein